MASSTIRVALLGFGLSGRYLQAPFFRTLPDFELVWVLSSRSELAAEYPGVRFTSNLDDILKDTSINLVSICTPNTTHYDLAVRCISAGKHILVEKPFVPTVKEALDIMVLAQRHHVQVMVFQNRRFDSDFRTVQGAVRSEDLGKILRVDIHYDRFRPTPNPKEWKEEEVLGTGLLYDIGSHLVDQAIALFGSPSSFLGERYRQRPQSKVVDGFDLFLYYKKLVVHLSSSLLLRETRPRYTVHGTDGTFFKYGEDVQEAQLVAGMLPNDPGFGKEPETSWGVLMFEREGKTIRINKPSFLGDWNSLFENIVDVIRYGSSPIVPMEDVLMQIHILESVSTE